ncbi:MAG: non-heme iron oxygenase ferredoxin subunit [Elusimicrobiota bacterium]
MTADAAVAKAADIAPGKVKVVAVGELRIALCNVEGTFYAVEDVCTHDDGPLGEGALEGCRIKCPRHGALFDVKTGAAVSMPAIVPVRTFPVKVKAGEIYIKV